MSVLFVSLLRLAGAGAQVPSEDLIVTEAPSGYTLYQGADGLNGKFSGDELVKEFGSAFVGEEDAGKFSVQARTWASADSTVIVLLASDGNEHSARESFLGALDALDGGERFLTGVDGTLGVVADSDGTKVWVGLWHQGPFGVQVMSSSDDAARAEAQARAMIARQAERIAEAVGKSPSIETSRTGEDGIAFRIGRVVGFLIFVTVIALVVRRARQR